MATPRKLSPQQEREVALAYLCGIDTDAIKEKYDVSKSTVVAHIVGKRSHDWNDSLVEYYRKTDLSNKDRNSAHLYLTFEERAVSTFPIGLVNIDKDKEVFGLVDRCIYESRIMKVIERTALKEYASVKSGYDRLLHAVLGASDDEYYLVKKEVVKSLRAAYTPEGLLSLDNIFSGVTQTIFEKVRDGCLGWSKMKKQVVKETLDLLPERERQVLGMRFGLDGYTFKTLEQLGADYNVVHERIRQIEARGLHKLRHPSRIQYLTPLLGFITDAELEANLEKVRYQQVRAEVKQELYLEVRHEIEKELKDRTESLTPEAASRQIDELELSVRAANCLALLGIKTVGELMTRTECELLRSKNFGRKSLREIKDVLADMNLTLERGK